MTLVTYDRKPLFSSETGRRLLRQAIQRIARRYPFEIVATILLPDHWHLIIQLPAADHDYSMRIRRIKSEFTSGCIDAGLQESNVTESQRRRGERGIWQPRFWEHTIYSEDDLEQCVDYIHWNPRKHGLATRVADYPWSSFHRFVQLGHYDIDWGGVEPKIDSDESYGEPE